VHLVLASASPRRADLLRVAGLEFTVAPVECDESVHPGEHPIDYAERIARAKADLAAAHAREHHPRAVLLTADTTVWTSPEGGPIGKPEDRRAAAAILRALIAAQPHRVTTAFALVDLRGRAPRTVVHHSTTEVWMRELGDAELEAYLDTDEWQGKAGGYGIQGRAAGFVRRIAGSYTTVVGLPLAEVLDALTALEAHR